jgi:phosphopantothenoylcysteine decarboxylase/phosphopantothenate--cysteine ligase
VRPFDGRRILLGITGGIASYKSAWLARLLAQAGAEVDVVMTRAAQEFVGAVTFQALTGRPVHSELFGSAHALDHIRLAQDAELIVVAPATADFIARVAHGHADDLLTAILLAAKSPVLLVPAMNDHMWSHAQTARNVAHAREIGYRVMEPATGPLAAGEGSGPGRMPEAETILQEIGRMLEPDQSLAGLRVLVTAGPTREPVDPVRFISNRSSGRMGFEIAEAALRRGAMVRVIAGPTSVPPPSGIEVTRVETTEAMAGAVEEELQHADVLVMAAAPADFRPKAPAREKIKKRSAPPAVELEPTADILVATRKRRKPGAVIVGFALETRDAVTGGREKLAAKGLDLVVVNDAREAGAGFEVDTNRVTIVASDGTEESLPLMSKRDVAEAILDRVIRVRRGS